MEGSLESKPRVSFEFEVEKVIGVSDDGRYLVKWTPAWVSRFHLVGCEHLIQEFLTQQSEMEMGPTDQVQLNVPTNQVQLEVPSASKETKDNGVKKNSNMEPEQYIDSQMLPIEPPAFDIKIEDAEEPDEKCTYIETTLDLSKSALADDSFKEHTTLTSLETSAQSTPPSTDDIFFKYQSKHLSSEPCSSSSSANQNQSQTSVNQQDDIIIINSNPTAAKLRCNICGGDFLNENDLQVHLKTHDSDEKHYTCPYCEKKFRVKCNLSTHLRTHTGEQPYSCAYCNYTCSFQGNLKVHMRIHTGEKPYCCELCGKTFTQSGTRNKHVARCARARKNDNVHPF